MHLRAEPRTVPGARRNTPTPPRDRRWPPTPIPPAPTARGPTRRRSSAVWRSSRRWRRSPVPRQRGNAKAALSTLEKLAEKNPTTPWNQATRASLLLNTGRAEEALEVLEGVLAAEPDNKSVLALHAAASLAVKGFEGSRQPLWRAFRKSAPHYPDLVSGVAAAAAGELYNRRRYPAAREHLACALRFAAPDRKQELFMRLMEFDGNAEVPYPLRSVHPLAEVPGEGDGAADRRQGPPDCGKRLLRRRRGEVRRRRRFAARQRRGSGERRPLPGLRRGPQSRRRGAPQSGGGGVRVRTRRRVRSPRPTARVDRGGRQRRSERAGLRAGQRGETAGRSRRPSPLPPSADRPGARRPRPAGRRLRTAGPPAPGVRRRPHRRRRAERRGRIDDLQPVGIRCVGRLRRRRFPRPAGGALRIPG